MLLKKLLKTKVYTSLGDAVGNLIDIYVDKTTWDIKYALVSKGIGKNSKLLYPIHYLLFAEGKNLTIFPENVIENVAAKEGKSYLSAHHMVGLEILSKDAKTIGKLYDIDVFVGKNKWTLWKLLVRVGRKERRLRLDAAEIATVNNRIKLQKTLTQLSQQDN